MENKRKMSSTSDVDAMLSGEEDVPRKKSRNYLDSHKCIEKKRRDRINNSLSSIKELVPDCKQFASKKLDKAEILEMCIEYLRRVQNHLERLGGGAQSLAISPREFATEISGWVLQQKPHHTTLDSFVQALLLHLSTYGTMSQPHIYGGSSDVHASTHDVVLTSPVATTISLAQTAIDSHALLQASQVYPPPYPNTPRLLDTHQSQIHQPLSVSGRLPVDDAVAAQEIWRNTAALLQQQYASQPDQHDPQSHQPPPLVAAPESLIGTLAQTSSMKPEMDVHNKGTTQPLHHLAMPPAQQPYQQMLILQPSTQSFHHPTTNESDAQQHQIQQLLQESYIPNGKQPQEIQITAQDLVHHSIRQQMLIAQGPSSNTADKAPATANPLTTSGSTTLTEELIDSGSADQSGTAPQLIVQGSESASWETAPVAMETTIEATGNLSNSHPKTGDLHKQSANMLLLLSKRDGETVEEQQDATASTPGDQ